MNKLIITLILIILTNSTSFAKTIGTTGATLFKIGSGARSIGMGEAFVAVSDDADALYFNPSGLGFIKKSELSFMHLNWFSDTKYEFLAHLLSPEHQKSGYGIGLIYLHNNKIKHTSNSGPYWSGEYFKFYDYGLILSYGRMITKDLSLGSNIKLFKEGVNVASDLKYDSTFNIMFDVGVLFKFRRKPLNLGCCFQNIGPKVKYKDAQVSLPLNIKLGILYRMFNDDLRIAFDLSKPNDNKVNFNLGLEYLILKMISLRGGYIKGISEVSKNFSLGMGFKLKNLYLDYAYVPYEDLGNTHRISFVIKGPFIEPWERRRDKKETRKKTKIEELLKEDKIKNTEDNYKDKYEYAEEDVYEYVEEGVKDKEESDKWEELEREFLRKYK